jgi:hypothetical protein
MELLLCSKVVVEVGVKYLQTAVIVGLTLWNKLEPIPALAALAAPPLASEQGTC